MFVTRPGHSISVPVFPFVFMTAAETNDGTSHTRASVRGRAFRGDKHRRSVCPDPALSSTPPLAFLRRSFCTPTSERRDALSQYMACPQLLRPQTCSLPDPRLPHTLASI